MRAFSPTPNTGIRPAGVGGNIENEPDPVPGWTNFAFKDRPGTADNRGKESAPTFSTTWRTHG
jgi:hypothetical protein